ncbi:MAG: hypothetical protein INR70_06650 [Parafilimonas terrae]|nr:hypothetical protein [Parafilimonas terrae]
MNDWDPLIAEFIRRFEIEMGIRTYSIILEPPRLPFMPRGYWMLTSDVQDGRRA